MPFYREVGLNQSIRKEEEDSVRTTNTLTADKMSNIPENKAHKLAHPLTRIHLESATVILADKSAAPAATSFSFFLIYKKISAIKVLTKPRVCRLIFRVNKGAEEKENTLMLVI